MSKFGMFVKETRTKHRLGLREFCLKYKHDPSNWSKIERGRILPPQDEKTLTAWAVQLGIKKGTADWFKFFDLAAAERGRIPEDILANKELVKVLPVFFRTLRGQKPIRKELKALAEIIRKS